MVPITLLAWSQSLWTWTAFLAEESKAPERSWGVASFIALVLVAGAATASFLPSRRTHKD